MCDELSDSFAFAARELVGAREEVVIRESVGGRKDVRHLHERRCITVFSHASERFAATQALENTPVPRREEIRRKRRRGRRSRGQTT
jgi:hypothetical protein